MLRRALILLSLGAALSGCGTGTVTTPTPQTVIGKVAAPPKVTGNATAGKQVFETAGCKSCHTLKDAGATGTVGPNLDDAKPDKDLVITRVTKGMGAMPPFAGQLTDQQIADVAAYVVQATGGS